MLGHLVDSTGASSACVCLDALYVAPKGLRVHRWFQWTILSHDSHLLDGVLLLENNFKRFVDDATLKSLDIPFVFLVKDGLQNEEVG